jgi:hypothetical protein
MEHPLKSHLLKRISGAIMGQKFIFTSKGLGKESTFVGISKEIILEGSMFDRNFQNASEGKYFHI